MPRAQMYISSNNYKKIQAIVESKREDGADRNESSISSVCGMLLEIGLRIYEYQQKKEGEEGGNDVEPSAFDQVAFNKILMDYVLKTSYASTVLLQMMGCIDEVKDKYSFDFESIRKSIRANTATQIEKIFPDE